MTSGHPVRIGVIGCGRVTERHHLPALRSIPEAEVVALADINPDSLRRVGDQFHITHRYTEVSALVNDPAVDAVAVCLPPRLHVEAALAALDAGKHLFIEKPVALDLDECNRLIQRAGRIRTKVTVGFNLRWHRLVRKAQDLIRRDTLGSIELMRTAWTCGTRAEEIAPEWRRRRKSGGGVMLDLAVHHVDLWRYLLGSEVEEVFAASRSGQRDDQTATLSARMANGVLVTSLYSDGTGDGNDVDIYGTAGWLHVSCYRLDGLEFFPTCRRPGDLRHRMRRVAHLLQELVTSGATVRAGGDYAASYRAQWRHFIDAIRRDGIVGCTLDDGRRALQVVLAAAESARLGQPVKISPPPILQLEVGRSTAGWNPR